MKQTLLRFTMKLTLMLMALVLGGMLRAQPATKDENVLHDPMIMRPGYVAPNEDAVASSVVTIGNYDNFKLGVDFAECSITNNPLNPLQYFAVWNSTGSAGGKGYYTLDGYNWNASSPSWTQMRGDVVVAYDSSGNLAYQNMYGASSILGVKVAISSNNGQTWAAPVNSNSGVDKNWLAADQTSGPFSNRLMGVMTANSGGSVSRSSDNGVSWQSSPNLNPQNLPGMSICIGPDGDIQGGSQYIVTNSGSSFASVYTFFESNDGGATFQQRSAQSFSNTVGSQVNGRNAVLNMRTRPYPNIAADNSYGPHRGRLYLVYASNNPTGNGNKPDIFLRYSDDHAVTWSPAKVVNDDPNSQNNHNWFPAIWTEKNTGRLYISWMDTRDTPTSDSAMIYATYTDDGITFQPNQQISSKKMKINCSSCGGGGTPMYLGDYNGIAANPVTAMLAWTDFRDNNFGSYTAYFPDYAMRTMLAVNDTLIDTLSVNVAVPSVKLYNNTVEFSAEVAPSPATGSFEFYFPNGNTLSTLPDSVSLQVVRQGDVPSGVYNLTVTGRGPNGTPVHKRSLIFKVVNTAPVAAFAATETGICTGSSIGFNDQSAGAPTQWEWAFTGGSPASSTAQNPSGITYPASGSYNVTLKVTNAFGSNTSSKPAYITVSDQPAAPVATNAEICFGLPVPQLTATGIDIRWYNDAALTTQVGSGNSFSTGQSLPGIYQYYATQSTIGCESAASIATLTIHPKPEAMVADFDPTCSAYPAFDLVNGTPAGGVYSGPGVSENRFDPSVAGVGEHKIIYIYTDENGCGDTASASIIVNESPATSLAPFEAVCANQAAFNLTGGLPEGGTWSGTGVSSGQFDPAAAGPGEHLITYSIAPVNGCEGMASQPLTVNTVPQPVLGSDTTLCANLAVTIDGNTPNGVSYLWTPGGATSPTLVVDSTGIGIGAAAFVLAVTSNMNCTGTDAVIVTFKDCTGIEEFAGALRLNIYPNPGNGKFALELNATTPLRLNLRVINTLGKEVYARQSITVNGSLKYTLDLSNQPDGMYVLYVYDTKSSISRKIIIYR
ncbi:MAG TPA: hypothetical protein DCR43_05580 [Bacteroidales bacterium]|nr:MAG: hypothetical protein A2X11_04150 [Bacteroidetes bacterium GWE2_42_24]OFY26054.1 MAG: hypothetical protein A2X09_11355 [Bacteroidetes bacterium GWF2_43_11]HAQ65305.1 hypothetical protein [Bacteroidales bacterium]HBZ65360.1 hypothetical protein [Bacteroidales bacterium]